MTSQGLRASSEGIRAAKTALTDKTLSQQKLAATIGITRQPVSKFFAGEPVSRSCFVQICQQLGLSWQKVASLPEDTISETNSQSTAVEIDVLVPQVRQKRQDKIQDQCSTIKMLDIAQAIPLAEVYTPVSMLEEITNQRWQEIADLCQELDSKFGFRGFGQSQHQKGLLGLEAVSRYSKLMVLGKAGSGKTTFLQYLAMECNQGMLQPQHVPIFIRLKEFAEDVQSDTELNLWQYISQEFLCSGIDEESTIRILTSGKALVLLDGLDEVPLDHAETVIREIRKFTQLYYKNQFVISCRIAAQKYRFQGFTEVEIADFNDQQVEFFVKKWFVAIAHHSMDAGEIIANQFIQQLNLRENHLIREFAATPILLHLLCLVFQVKAKFPVKPANLCDQALNILLARWDEIRGIKRDNFYSNLTLIKKKKLLAYLAVSTFTQENYFFEQDKIQQLVSEYLSRLPNTDQQTVQLQQNSAAIMQGIEAQDGLLIERSRGIYSFSHLAFQEYLTAKYIVENFLDEGKQLLVNHMSKARWQNAVLLTVSMFANTDEILQLMKNRIDSLVVDDDKIQNYLIWLHQKTSSIPDIQKSADVRAFYLVCTYAFAYTPHYGREWDYMGNLAFNPELSLDELLSSILNCANDLYFTVEHTLNDDYAFNHARALNINLEEAIDLAGNAQLQQELRKLQKKLPSTESNLTKFRHWWCEQGKDWQQKLRTTLIQYRNIGHDWQFSHEQIQLLQQYFQDNKLLINALKYSANDVLKQKIEDGLFLAIAKITP
ncbi:NACHT domain-containing NTPase [Nostoc sp. TCL26-01]|uniref:NACHT domain-containing protein n=1 Tax=Nostoc sp. TCL26-01 TaxID=2576904 RepID=UPI0015BC9620|nr:NACHT domain-containing NTPase [Nostoc sp. TCL26-01]QLE58005.1 NACHT domain-containing NTPase [Nostoc sp. TCL26-01]